MLCMQIIRLHFELKQRWKRFSEVENWRIKSESLLLSFKGRITNITQLLLVHSSCQEWDYSPWEQSWWYFSGVNSIISLYNNIETETRTELLGCFQLDLKKKIRIYRLLLMKKMSVMTSCCLLLLLNSLVITATCLILLSINHTSCLSKKNIFLCPTLWHRWLKKTKDRCFGDIRLFKKQSCLLQKNS